ncbi:MAG: hypothetical protein ABEL76_10255 [Bradymonadaceae bacterium]
MDDTEIGDILAAAGAPVEIEELERAFDRADHGNRVEAIRALDGARQAALFEAAEGRDATLDQLVPPDTPPLEEIVHEGHNSLPVFSAFQKRFCRPSGGDAEELFGYNEQAFRALTGPGYFVAGEVGGQARIDYRRLPDERLDEWPEIVPNERRLGRFVYAGTVDRMRRLSDHVTVGRAYDDDEEPMDNWFLLVRRDPA